MRSNITQRGLILYTSIPCEEASSNPSPELFFLSFFFPLVKTWDPEIAWVGGASAVDFMAVHRRPARSSTRTVLSTGTVPDRKVTVV